MAKITTTNGISTSGLLSQILLYLNVHSTRDMEDFFIYFSHILPFSLVKTQSSLHHSPLIHFIFRIALWNRLDKRVWLARCYQQASMASLPILTQLLCLRRVCWLALWAPKGQPFLSSFLVSTFSFWWVKYEMLWIPIGLTFETTSLLFHMHITQSWWDWFHT